MNPFCVECLDFGPFGFEKVAEQQYKGKWLCQYHLEIEKEKEKNDNN